MAVSILSHGNDETGQTPTQRYADARWRERPVMVPSSWRVSQGLTLGKLVHDARVDVSMVGEALRDGCNGVLASEVTLDGVMRCVAAWPGGRDEVVVMVEGGVVEGVDVVLVREWDSTVFERCEALVKAGKLGCYGIVAAVDTDVDGVVKLANVAAAKVWGRLKRPALRALRVQLDAGDVRCAVVPATLHKDERVSVLEYAARMDFLVVAEGGVELAGEPETLVALEKVVVCEQDVYARLGGWPEREGVPYFSLWRMLLAGVQPFPTVAAARRWREEVMPELVRFWRERGEDGYVAALVVLGDMCEGMALLAIRARLGWNGAPLDVVARGIAASVPGVTCVLGRGSTLPFYALPDVVDVSSVVDTGYR